MKIQDFLGIRNVVNIRHLPDNSLSDAVDVDIDDSGAIIRRNGHSLTKAIANITSAYSTPEQEGYVVADSTLSRLDSSLNTIPICTSTATQFCNAGLYVITNDGWMVHNDNAQRLIISIPLQPTVSIINGFLPAGVYSILQTYENGLESGTSDVLTVDVESGQGIRIVPHETPPAGYTAKFYVTEAGGEAYYYVGSGQVDFRMTGQLQGRLKSVNIGNKSFAACDLVEFHRGKLWASTYWPEDSKSIIRYSQPGYFHLFDEWKDFFMIEGKVLIIASTFEGLFVGTDAAMYMYDEAQYQLIKLADYGVVDGRPVAKRDNTLYIHSVRGECTAFPFKNLSDGKVSLAPGTICSTAIVEQNGFERFVIVHDGGGVAYNKAF